MLDGGAVAVFEGVDEAVGLLMTTTGGASGECLGGENTSFRAGCCILLFDDGCSGVVAVGVPLTGGRTGRSFQQMESHRIHCGRAIPLVLKEITKSVRHLGGDNADGNTRECLQLARPGFSATEDAPSGRYRSRWFVRLFCL